MSQSLIDRVRERLAAESAPLQPNVVAAAIRAESGGVLGDTEVLSNLRLLQTELTGVGILEPLLRAAGTTDVLVTAPDAVWIDDGNGLRRSPIRFADEAAVKGYLAEHPDLKKRYDALPFDRMGRGGSSGRGY